MSYGQEVHRRIGTAAALAVVSLGIGAIVAFSKSKKHYVGITWANGTNKGGIVLQIDKNEYRGVIAGLEGVSGRRAVDTDSPRSHAQARLTPQMESPPTAAQAALKPLFTGEHHAFGSPNKFERLSFGEQAPLNADRYFFFRDRVWFAS